MSTAEQKKIKDIATKLLKEPRSKDQVLKTLRSAGIVDKAGKIKSPYDQVFVQK
jgi:DNA-binding transcriptional ArsR family regulator